MAVELISRFPRAGLTELAAADPNFGLRRAMKSQWRSLIRTARCVDSEKETERLPWSRRCGGVAERLCYRRKKDSR